MEMSVRTNRSSEISAAINQQFYNLIRLSEQPDQMTEIAYQSTQLLQDIEEQLPNLPTTRDEQNAQATQSQAQTSDKVAEQDWAKITTESINVFNKLLPFMNKAMRKKPCLPYKTLTLMYLKVLAWKTKWAHAIATLKQN